jgi:hypothetical protein
MDVNEKNGLIQVGVDLYKGSLIKFSAAEGNNTLRKAFVDILGTDKPNYKQFRRHKIEIFEVMEEVLSQTITEGFANPFFEQFVERRDVNLGDSNEFYVEDRTVLSVARHAGNHWDMRRQKLNIGESVTVPTEPLSASVYTDFLRFLAGRIDWSALINKISAAFVNEVQNRIYTDFLGTIDYLPAEFKGTGTFTEQTLLEIAAHVQAANQNSSVTISGTKTALAKLSDVETLSDGMKDHLNQVGILQYWKGYNLLPITQSHVPNTFDFQITDDRLFIMPSDVKPIKLVHEGEPLIKEVSDGTTNMDMSMEYKFIDRFGVATMFNTLYGQYQFS